MWGLVVSGQVSLASCMAGCLDGFLACYLWLVFSGNFLGLLSLSSYLTGCLPGCPWKGYFGNLCLASGVAGCQAGYVSGCLWTIV